MCSTVSGHGYLGRAGPVVTAGCPDVPILGGVTSECGDTGSELPSSPTSSRRFGQLPDLGVSDDFDKPLPRGDVAVWEASDTSAHQGDSEAPDEWTIDELDDWPFDDPSIDVAALLQSLRESDADRAAGHTFGEEEIRARYGLPRPGVSDRPVSEPR